MSGIVAWWVYGTGVAVLLGLAALLAEESARDMGRPGRFVWLVALVLSAVLPALAYFGVREVAGAGGVVPELPVLTLTAVQTAVVVADDGWSVAWLILALWVAATSVLAVVAVVSGLRLRAARKEWRRAELYGVTVWLTRDLGPAVFGVRSAQIVIPEWVMALDRSAQRLLLLHEREHVRAGDPLLLIAGLVVVTLLPWNPALWWMLLRLRLAVEVDCDARVLSYAPDARAYGRVLLEVGRQRREGAMLVAFAEPRRFLERRIRRISARRVSHPIARALGLGLAASAALGVAFCAEDPLSPPELQEPETARTFDLPVADEPAFTPMTIRPELVNVQEVERALERNYPPLLRDAGIGGTAIVWFFIDEQGRVLKAQLNRSSGHQALDEAALKVASVMVFSPAKNRSETVRVWVQLPIRFVSTAAAAGATRTQAPSAVDTPPRPRRVAARRQADAAAQPTFTPMTRRPELANQAEVARALEGAYPPLLRDAGIGGTTILWFFIDPVGNVAKTQIERGSGYAALDEAAVRVAGAMKFSPAENRGEPVAVWVQIPIKFTAK
jgi:TonB family protein